MAFSHIHTLFLADQNAHFAAGFSFFPGTRLFFVGSGGFNQNSCNLGAGSQIGVPLSKHVCSEAPINV